MLKKSLLIILIVILTVSLIGIGSTCDPDKEKAMGLADTPITDETSGDMIAAGDDELSAIEEKTPDNNSPLIEAAHVRHNILEADGTRESYKTWWDLQNNDAAKLICSRDYEINIEATDPDNDNLYKKIIINEEIIEGFLNETIKWTAPDTPGTYTITIIVTDGKGGEASESFNVEVFIPLELQTIILEPILAESGSAVTGANTFNDGINYIGDSDCDNSVFSFVSFDIGPLKGATVNKATLGLTIPFTTAGSTQTFTGSALSFALATSPTTSVPVRNSADADVVGIGDNYMIDNDPANFGAFVGHIPLESIEDGNATLSDEELKNKLQENIDQELDRLVLAIATEDLYSNDNGISEVFLIEVVLDVEYTMPETTISGAMQEIMGGIGALLTQDNEGRILVLESIADSPAYKAGIQEGDWFIGVGGADMQGKDINTVVNEIIGPIGTKVAITAVRFNQVLVFICTREALPETEENE